MKRKYQNLSSKFFHVLIDFFVESFRHYISNSLYLGIFVTDYFMFSEIISNQIVF